MNADNIFELIYISLIVFVLGSILIITITAIFSTVCSCEYPSCLDWCKEQYVEYKLKNMSEDEYQL